LLVITAGCLVVAPLAFAASPENAGPSRELVKEALHRELYGLQAERDALQADPERQRAARERLMQIGDSHAIPTMEAVVSMAGEEGALAVIDAADKLHGQEATDAMIRHAVMSNLPLVRQAAAERLRERSRESFVPAMLGEMYTLASSQFQITRLANGRLGYRHVMEREGRNERQVLQLDTEYARSSRSNGEGRDSLLRAFADSVRGAAQRDVAVAQRNFGQLALNDRLTAALNIATNQQLPADPQRWWQWWDEENDIVRQGEKQTRSQQEFRQVSIADRRPQSGRQSSPTGRQAECFVAGTPVWTRRGLAAIEKVRVGDLILGQDPNTGEVAFKPVLRTTIRPASKLVKVTAGRETFESSHGHLYWVVGHGWAKARLLDSGMQLHCLTGTVPVDKLEEGAEAETYNLVVADFNSYFVGKQRVLSHDVTERQPTTSIVPGLAGDE